MSGPYGHGVAQLIPGIVPAPVGRPRLSGLLHVLPPLHIIAAFVIETYILERFTPGVFHRRLPLEHLLPAMGTFGALLVSHR